MSVKLTVSLTESASAQLERFRAAYKPGTARHKEMLGFAKDATLIGVREYVQREAETRHATAERLGAQPTGHLTRAANQIDAEAGREEITLKFPRTTGLQRAFGNLTILPGSGRQYLTVPAHKDSYGRRAGEFPDLVFTLIKEKFPALIWTNGARVGTVAFWLIRKATIPKDRALLPSEGQFGELLGLGVQNWFDAATAKRGGGLA